MDKFPQRQGGVNIHRGFCYGVFSKMIPRGKTDTQEQKFVISLLKTEKWFLLWRCCLRYSKLNLIYYYSESSEEIR